MLDVRAVEVLHEYISQHPDVHYFHSSLQQVDQDGQPMAKIRQAKETIEVSDFVDTGPVKHLHCWRVHAD